MSGPDRSDEEDRDPRPDLDAAIDRLLVTRAGAGYDRMRGEAVAALLGAGKAGHDAVVERLRSSDNPRPLLRVLPRFGLDASVPVLLDVLYRAGADPVVRATAADALADHPSPAAAQALAEALASGDPAVRAAAVSAAR